MNNWYKIAKHEPTAHGMRDTDNQTGWTDLFGDVQRYALDPYRCQVFLSKTNAKITVSCTVAHDQFGLVVFQDYWKFSRDKMSTAKKVFAEVKEAVTKIFNEFEGSETPNNMLHSTIREAVRYIYAEHKPTTRNKSIDEARRWQGVADWRTSIYGTRYPIQSGF